jgi:5-(carboxyamino)imidazole ribonucleotide synthase
VPTSPDDRMRVLGMVGAGQLARMTHQATVGLAWPFRVFAEHPEESAAWVHGDVVVGSIASLDDVEAFAATCDVVTFDHELVDPDILTALEDRGHVLRPSAAALLHAQDKLHQRQRLQAAGFPVPSFRAVDGPDDIVDFGDQHGWPVVAKAVRGGYDGRGVWVVEDAAMARTLVDEARAHGTDLLVEELVPIERELAVAVARRPSGPSVTYPTTETVQRDGILVELLVPAPVPASVRHQAEDLATRIVEAVDATGLVAVELFQTAAGLLVNELAMRPHNSMHWTIEGARTSQFQNHARAALDLPLGTTTTTAPCVVTVNVLGPADGSDPRDRLAGALAVPDVGVHLYGKAARPGRKLGHVTAVGDDPDDTRARARRAVAALTGEGDEA